VSYLSASFLKSEPSVLTYILSKLFASKKQQCECKVCMTRYEISTYRAATLARVHYIVLG